MKPLPHPTTAPAAAHMRMRQAQNLSRALRNPNENWLAQRLSDTGVVWARQATWGCRLYDFWSHALGIAIETDGPEHRRGYDAYRDEYNYRRSGIVVLRVRNQNEVDLAEVLAKVASAMTWSERRERLGLNGTTKAARRRWVAEGIRPADVPKYC